MADVAEITRLVNSYGLPLDQGDIDGVVALFQHSTWRGNADRPVLRGRAEVRPVYEQLPPAGADRTHRYSAEAPSRL
jgi:SnoaL-like domain